MLPNLSTSASNRSEGRDIKTTRAPRLASIAAVADPAPVAPVTTTVGCNVTTG
jgi:hypothetical protein